MSPSLSFLPWCDSRLKCPCECAEPVLHGHVKRGILKIGCLFSCNYTVICCFHVWGSQFVDLEMFPLHSETIGYKFPHTVQEIAANVHKLEQALTRFYTIA